MDKKLYLRLLIHSVFFLPLVIFSQEWKKIKSIQLTQSPSSYSVDIKGNIYLGFKDGGMTKYDHEGIELVNYSLSNQSSITSIDAQNSLKLFLFYYDNQQMTILDRFSTIPKNYQLNDYGISFGAFACPSPDGNFWVIENNPIRLKKVAPIKQALILEVQTSIGNQVKYMRAYQNILIISDENGLQIFDQYGSNINTLKGISPSYVHVTDNQLIAYYMGDILTINPFKGVAKKMLIAPLKEADGMMISREKYVF